VTTTSGVIRGDRRAFAETRVAVEDAVVSTTSELPEHGRDDAVP
jgi:hypothetical protein